jgi:Tfp pilus assembly protein PilW
VNSLARVDGFTVSELLVATAITLTITAALLGLIDRARGAFEAQPERGDMHQRLRVAVDALSEICRWPAQDCSRLQSHR